MAKSNVIELNGRRYDALTGSFLGESTAPVIVRQQTPPGHRGRFIDGFVKAPKKVSTNATQSTPFIPVQPTPKRSSPKSAARHTSKHLSAHQPEHAKTLMRSAVSKPAITAKARIKTQAPAEVAAAPVSTLVPKLSAAQIDPSRQARAQTIKKSEVVKKFTPNRATLGRTSFVAPVRARAGAQPVSPNGGAALHPRTTPEPPRPPKPDMFEAALARATSHEHPAPVRKKRRPHRRLVNVLAGSLAVLLIACFVGYLNAANIELRIASAQAGFHATLPSYRPVGYSMARTISAQGRRVTISFHSDNGSAFKLTQQASNWDSQTLYDDLIAAKNTSHQTIESSGRTVYLFGNTNAAWVNGGVLYQISGTAELSNDQVSQLATSM